MFGLDRAAPVRRVSRNTVYIRAGTYAWHTRFVKSGRRSCFTCCTTLRNGTNAPKDPGYPSGSGGLDIFTSAPGELSVITGFAAAFIGCALALIYGTLTAVRILRSQR